MLQDIAREPDGEVLLSTNTVTGEKTYLHISSTCKIEPVCDDMATCYPGCRTSPVSWYLLTVRTAGSSVWTA